ncbi:replication initiation protein [Helicobacter pylori]|uniref:replication initiation protein n=4 Tax=Helicobacter pylori TaxID=210 RepID=UPI00165A573A|nr:replication initiation protein [Helicobacter pylori]
MPRVNNEPKPNKRPTVKKSQKYLITQDNRLIHAKYGDITANEIKVFYYIISKLNSINDKGFEVCEIPINEILCEVLDHENLDANYLYIKKLCDSLVKRYLLDQTRSVDPVTNKEVHEFTGMPLFKILKYKEGEATIKYQLNEYLKPYLIGLKEKFLSYRFQKILPINSGYAIRIYQMLLSERKQNKTKIEMPLLYLQDVLCVPKSMYIFGSFKQKILDPSLEEINRHTELVVMVDPKKLIKEKKEKGKPGNGKKIIGITFEFDYKDSKQRQEQYKKKAIHQLGVRIVKPLEKLKGKTLDYMVNGKTQEIVYHGQFKIDENKQEVIAIFEEIPRKNTYTLHIKTPEDIEKLKAMHENYNKKFFTQNASKVLKNKDGKGSVYIQQIQENLKQRKEEEKAKAIEKPTLPLLENKATTPMLLENKATPIENKPTQEAINQEAPTTHKIFEKAFREANKQQKVKSMTENLGNLFEQHTTKKDPPNQ